MKLVNIYLFKKSEIVQQQEIDGYLGIYTTELLDKKQEREIATIEIQTNKGVSKVAKKKVKP